MFWTYINSGGNEIPITFKIRDSNVPIIGSVVAVYGITGKDDSTIFQIYSPRDYSYPIELIPFYTRPMTEQTVWKLWFLSDSSGSFREWDLGKIPTSKLRIYGFARRPVIKLKPYAMPLEGPLDSLINSSFGIGVRYGYDFAQKNEISSEGRSVMFLKTVLGENADSLTLRITSPLRPLPFVILNGDEIILKGKFALKAKPGTRNITMQLTGLATSIRLNDKELLPRYLEVYRDWLIALLSITASISVILSFIGKWFFEWPWPSRGQAEKPRPRYRPFWMRRTRR